MINIDNLYSLKRIKRNQYRGVNLGGWLVLEKWIKPSLFNNLPAVDETSFCLELGDSARDVLELHRKTFITEPDFEWLSKNNINTVRVPVPYWIFGDIQPYVGCIDYLDLAFDMAEKYGLKVLIDLHTVPGSQNGWDHSGRVGAIEWHKEKENIDLTLSIIDRLAERYKDKEALMGIELINEPHWLIPQSILKKFYKDGYNIVRKYCNEDVAVIFSDSFRSIAWYLFMQDTDFKNVILDIHHYQCFSDSDKCMNIKQHGKKIDGLGNRLNLYQKNFNTIVGEWSLGLDPQSFHGQSAEEVAKQYADIQLEQYNSSVGWFFWTYKTEEPGGWNFRDCVEKGLLTVNKV